MAALKAPDKFKDFPRMLISQMILLSTGGFGVVVALAWNEFIKNLVEVYIKPYLGQGSGVFSLLVYAVVITLIAVLVTMQLTKIQKRLDTEVEEKINAKIEAKAEAMAESKVKAKKDAKKKKSRAR
jgi:hypothetical protein